VVLLLIFALNQRGTGDTASTPTAQQTVPPATARTDRSDANTPSRQPGAGEQNTGTRPVIEQRSSDVDAISGGSVRNPGSGKVAPGPQQ
jgi:hypothetical protein